MSVIAIIGMEGLKIFDKLSVPLLFIIMVVGLVLAFQKYGTAGITANEVETATMSFAEAVALSFSFFSAMAFTAADVTRWQRNRKRHDQILCLGSDAGWTGNLHYRCLAGQDCRRIRYQSGIGKGGHPYFWD